jgi:hypothetical protein
VISGHASFEGSAVKNTCTLMNRVAFESNSVPDQLSLVASGLAQAEPFYLRWFCSLHDPRHQTLEEGYEEILTAVRSHLPHLLPSVQKVGLDYALEFVLFLRIVGRIGFYL